VNFVREEFSKILRQVALESHKRVELAKKSDDSVPKLTRISRTG